MLARIAFLGALVVAGFVLLADNPGILGGLIGAGGPSGDQAACLELVTNFATALRNKPTKSGATDFEPVISGAMADCNEGRYASAFDTVARHQLNCDAESTCGGALLPRSRALPSG